MSSLSFSIITVTYNAEKVLERTIKSVAAQTYPNIEYIIIDGGSTDGTLRIIQNSTSKIQNFICISEPDNGLYDAMNKGLLRATGNYVWFLNAGDVLHEDTTVEQIISRLSNIHTSKAAAPLSTPDIIYGETDIVDEDGRFVAHRRLKAPKKLSWKSFRMGMMVCHQSFIVQRATAPLYDLQYHFSADFEWCIRCMKSANSIFNTQLVLSDYLNQGVTTRNRKASLKERFNIMTHYYGLFPSALRHLWFAIRFYFTKLLGRQL